MQSSDCNVLDLTAAEGAPGKLYAFRLQPFPTLGWHLFPRFPLLHRIRPVTYAARSVPLARLARPALRRSVACPSEATSIRG